MNQLYSYVDWSRMLGANQRQNFNVTSKHTLIGQKESTSEKLCRTLKRLGWILVAEGATITGRKYETDCSLWTLEIKLNEKIEDLVLLELNAVHSGGTGGSMTSAVARGSFRKLERQLSLCA